MSSSSSISKGVLSVFALMRALPEAYRCSGQFARDFVAMGSESLASVPVNRAPGLQRLRFLKRELSALLPKQAKSSLRALVAR